MVKNPGLACKFIISKYPQDTPVTERTIPLAIFQSEPKICCYFLKKWTKNSGLTVDKMNIREVYFYKINELLELSDSLK